MVEKSATNQALIFATHVAEELASRQVLLRGVGFPFIHAPIGVEYEDTGVSPSARYRKVGPSRLDWKRLQIVEIATQSEVEEGVNDTKMVTPLTLANRLASFSNETLVSRPTVLKESPAIARVQASATLAGAAFEISLPPDITNTLVSIEVFGHGDKGVLIQINGGLIGQIVVLRKSGVNTLQIESSTQLKVSSPFALSDVDNLDSISMQKVEERLWVEIDRASFR